MKKIIPMLSIIAIITMIPTLVTAHDISEYNISSMPSILNEYDSIESEYNEYDYIVKVRNANKQEIELMDLSEKEIEYINSTAIENELLYRASLSVEELRDHYCYSAEAISILKAYDGTPLENAPEMRIVMASFYAALGQIVGNETRIGVTYVWEWSTEPICAYTDGVTVSWEGTYENGLNNNMRFDIHTSFANVDYYLTTGEEETVQLSKNCFSSDAYTNGVAVKFPCLKTFNGLNYWAKSGAAFIYADLVNQENGPMLAALDVCGKYAHASMNVDWSVSFPWGLSASFSGDVDILGEKHLTIRP